MAQPAAAIVARKPPHRDRHSGPKLSSDGLSSGPHLSPSNWPLSARRTHDQRAQTGQHHRGDQAADEDPAAGPRPGGVEEDRASPGDRHLAFQNAQADAGRDGDGQVAEHHPGQDRQGGVAQRRRSGQLPTLYRSPATPKAPTMAEFLTMAMITLPSGGTTLRIACGITTNRSDWPNVNPMARAASA